MKVDLNLLPLFLAVAQEHYFRAAADRLGVTRSAVSQGVRRLEDTFGTGLVLRTTRSVRLTEAGERLLAAIGAQFVPAAPGTRLDDDVFMGRPLRDAMVLVPPIAHPPGEDIKRALGSGVGSG